MNAIIEKNRKDFLHELRFGNRKKGTIKSDDKGYPIVKNEEDHGYCAYAIMREMFGGTNYSNVLTKKALGLKPLDCSYIQRELNDTPLTFPEIAERIEQEIFNRNK